MYVFMRSAPYFVRFNLHRRVSKDFSKIPQYKISLKTRSQVSSCYMRVHEWDRRTDRQAGIAKIIDIFLQIFVVYDKPWPIPLAARSKAWVYGRSLTWIVGSNPA
jgi:hypothetical protein